MKYVKVYQSRHPEYLKIILKVLHENAIPARLRMQDDSIVEVPEKDYIKAKHYIADDQDIFMSTLDVDINERFSPKYEEEYARGLKDGQRFAEPRYKLINVSGWGWLKFILISDFLGIGMFITFFFGVITLNQGPAPKIYGYLSLALTMLSILVLRYAFPAINKINFASKKNPRKKALFQKMKYLTKNSINIFWLLAILTVYLFFTQYTYVWEEVMSGNRDYIFILIAFFGFILVTGSLLYFLKFILEQDVKKKQPPLI